MDTFRNIRDDGVIKAANAAQRLALLLSDGTLVIQLDTNELWEWDAATDSWVLLATGIPITGVSSLNGLTGDIDLVAGTGITITVDSPSPNDILIDSFIEIGQEVVGGDPNSVLFVDGSGKLADDPDNFIYNQTSKLFRVGFADSRAILAAQNDGVYGIGDLDSFLNHTFVWVDDNNQRIGLNTDAPTGLLHLVNANTTDRFLYIDVGNEYLFGDSDVAGNYLRIDVSGIIELQSDNNVTLVLNNSSGFYAIGDLNSSLNTNFIAVRDDNQFAGTNVTSPQAAWDINLTRIPEIGAAVYSGSGLDDATSGGAYTATFSSTVQVIIRQVDISYIVSSGLLFVGETATGQTSGATGTVTNDSGTVLTIEAGSGAFVFGEIVLGGVSGNTVEVNSTLDYFDWIEGTTSDGSFAINGSPQSVGTNGVTIQFTNSDGHDLGSFWTIETRSFPILLGNSSDTTNKLSLNDDGTFQLLNYISGTTFYVDARLGQYFLGDISNSNTGMNFQIQESIDGSGDATVKIFDANDNFLEIDTNGDFYKFGRRNNQLIIQESGQTAQIIIGGVDALSLDLGNALYTIADPRGVAMGSFNNSDPGQSIIGDANNNGNRTLLRVDDPLQIITGESSGIAGLSLDFINGIYELGDPTSTAFFKAIGPTTLTTMGDVNANGNGTIVQVDDTNSNVIFNKPKIKINSLQYTWPSANANAFLVNDGAGILSWGGFPINLATVNLLGQTTGATTTLLRSPFTTGFYRFSGYIVVSTAAVAGTISATMGYNDGVQGQSPNPFAGGAANLLLTGVGNQIYMAYNFHAVTGTDITIKTTVGGVTGSPVFNQYMQLERLS